MMRPMPDPPPGAVSDYFINKFSLTRHQCNMAMYIKKGVSMKMKMALFGGHGGIL
jgi:hypothetical protein